MRYQDKVAIVTGAASGIGAALCTELSRRGAHVVLADANHEAASELASTLSSAGGSAHAAELDVRDREAFQRLVADTVEQKGRVDLLFNNAGVGLAGEVGDLSHEDWQKVVDVNLWGVIHGVTTTYPTMLKQGFGHIVNVSSGAGLAPRPGMVPYAATKHAVVGLSTSLRLEAAAHGVGVSVVCPGFIGTNILAATRYVNQDPEQLTAGIPLRPVSAEACARKILRGTAANRAIIVVGVSAWLEWWLFRLSPNLGLWLSKLRARRFRQSRCSA